jgi:hypothetical protein
MVRVHDLTTIEELPPQETESFVDAHQEQAEDLEAAELLEQAATQRSTLASTDIRRVLSTKAQKKPAKPNLWIETSVHELTYHVSNHRGRVDDYHSNQRCQWRLGGFQHASHRYYRP